MLPQEVFLSHSSTDRDFAERLVQTLHSHGVPTWFSRTNIVGAQQWHDEIGAALRRCDWLVLVLSPDSVESIWVKRELQYALQQNRFENKIVPLISSACDHERLSWTLSSLQMIDFTGSFQEGCRELLRIWGLGYRDASSARTANHPRKPA